MRREIFPCKKCGGTGGNGPIRKSTGRPFRECVSCSGDGEIIREVEATQDAMLRMSLTAMEYWDSPKGRARALGKPTVNKNLND